MGAKTVTFQYVIEQDKLQMEISQMQANDFIESDNTSNISQSQSILETIWII